MYGTCSNCQHRNPPQSQYCGACGSALVACVRAAAGSASWLLKFGLVAAVVAFGLIWIASPGDRGVTWRLPVFDPRPLPEVQANLILCEHRKKALYGLLAPADIAVQVARRDDGLSIIGTPKEVETLKRFAGLLTRLHGLEIPQFKVQMSKARELWTTSDTYRLPRDKMSPFFDVLAYHDVPVLVSWGGKKIWVSATPSDQEVVRNIVEILRGERL